MLKRLIVFGLVAALAAVSVVSVMVCLAVIFEGELVQVGPLSAVHVQLAKSKTMTNVALADLDLLVMYYNNAEEGHQALGFYFREMNIRLAAGYQPSTVCIYAQKVGVWDRELGCLHFSGGSQREGPGVRK